MSAADRRAALHVLTGSLALSLRFLPAPAAVALGVALVLHNVLVFPRTMPSLVRTPPRPDAGLVTYPLGVLFLILLFRDRAHLAAAGWGILAAGDGAASLVGRRATRALPWNSDKRWAGTIAFALAGAAAGGALLLAVGGDAAGSARGLGIVAAASVAAALAESLPMRLDDNVRVVAGSAVVLGAAPTWGATLAAVPGPRALAVLAVVAGLGIAAWASRTAGAAGVLVGVVLAAAIGLGAGWGALAALTAFLALARFATRWGREAKEARGLAQARAGRRGAAHAFANLGLAAGLALAAPGSGNEPLLRLALSASLATAAFDTVATEIGQARAGGTRSPLTGRRVAPGTPGGVSAAGTGAGLAAAMVVAWVAGVSGLHSAADTWIVGAAALAGGTGESFLGASPRARTVLDGHTRNLLNTAFGAGVAWTLGRWVGI